MKYIETKPAGDTTWSSKPMGPSGTCDVHEILLMGDSMVGKTSLASQFCCEVPDERHAPTIDSTYRFQREVDRATCMVEIIDTDGRDATTDHLEKIYSFGHILVVVFSVDSEASFRLAGQLFSKFSNMQGPSEGPLPAILVANKRDKAMNREVKALDGEALARQNCCHYVESSANLWADATKVFDEAIREARRQAYFRSRETC